MTSYGSYIVVTIDGRYLIEIKSPVEAITLLVIESLVAFSAPTISSLRHLFKLQVRSQN